MSSREHEKKVRRKEELKKKALREQEVKKLRNEMSVKTEAQKEFEKEKLMILNLQKPTKELAESVVNYIADRNGCGYYRCIWPFELLSTYKDLSTMNIFVYMFDPDFLRTVRAFRFQRQATNVQRKAWDMYLELRERHGYHYQLHYEIDDLLMEIEKFNKVAYDFFDEEKKQNHMYMLKSADRITFSTEQLKKVYVEKYGVDPSKIRVVKNTLPQFLYNLPIRSEPTYFGKEDKVERILRGMDANGSPMFEERKTSGRKPRVFWSGSASHLGPNGDLAFLLPLIRQTIDEYQWVFQGVYPPELESLVKTGKIEFIPWYPTYGLSNIQFYRARPDICLAPLKPNFFNTCKSDLKLLECSALGAPVVCTSFNDYDVGGKSPYEDVAEICIEPNADIWKSAIDHLVSDQNYYMEVVKKQYKNLNSRWMENYLDTWESTLL